MTVLMIHLEMFTKGFYLFDFDLTADREADEEHWSLPRKVNVRIEGRFNKPLSETVNCILYAEFPRHFEIDNSRNVTWIKFYLNLSIIFKVCIQ